MVFGGSLASGEMIQVDPSEVSDDILEQGARLFGAFSNEDALRLFIYAEHGISSSTQAMKDLGLTQKRYYSRLKGLLELGLLEKVEGNYVYTSFGEMMHKIGLSLIGVLQNKERIDILYNLSKSNVLTHDERSKITKVIADNSNIENLLSSMITGVAPSDIKHITNYEELAELLTEEIRLAKKSVLLASNYIDARVVEAQIQAHRRGVEFKVLLSKKVMSNKMKKLKLLLSPKILMNLLDFTKFSNNDEWFREANLSFSFCIIDGYKCMFEFPPIGEEFSLAFYLKDKLTSSRFSILFDKFWKASGELYEGSFSKMV